MHWPFFMVRYLGVKPIWTLGKEKAEHFAVSGFSNVVSIKA